MFIHMDAVKPATKSKKGSYQKTKYISRSLILKTFLSVLGIALILSTTTSIMANETLEAAKRMDIAAGKILNHAQKIAVIGELNLKKLEIELETAKKELLNDL